MPHFKETELQDKNNLIITYQGANASQVEQWTDDQFKTAGYNLKSGSAINGSYEKGNRTLRILFGAFIKYFKFNSSIEESGEVTRLTITKATSGMSGGAIGIGQVKTEFERIAKEMKRL